MALNRSNYERSIFHKPGFFLGGECREEKRGKRLVQMFELWHHITHSQVVGLKHYKATRAT